MDPEAPNFNPHATIEDNSCTLSTIHHEYPSQFEFISAYPNPFNPSTYISYQLLESSPIQINVINSKGIHITTLENNFKNKGSYSITWDASPYSNGIYFIQLIGPNSTRLEKVILIK